MAVPRVRRPSAHPAGSEPYTRHHKTGRLCPGVRPAGSDPVRAGARGCHPSACRPRPRGGLRRGRSQPVMHRRAASPSQGQAHRRAPSARQSPRSKPHRSTGSARPHPARKPRVIGSGEGDGHFRHIGWIGMPSLPHTGGRGRRPALATAAWPLRPADRASSHLAVGVRNLHAPHALACLCPLLRRQSESRQYISNLRCRLHQAPTVASS